MPTDLSFAQSNAMSKDIASFYTELHSAMNEMAGVGEAPFPTAREFRHFIKRNFPKGLSGLKCLDAGCGATAVNACSMLLAGADPVIALDINSESLDLARSRMRAGGFTGVFFRYGSVLDLPLPAETFDFIACAGVIHHTVNPENALREIFRVAKKGATVYISVYCFARSFMLLAVRLLRLLACVVPFRVMHALFRSNMTINNFVLDHMYVPILLVFRSKEFQELLEQTGFVVQKRFRSSMDPFSDTSWLGRFLSGDGLLRVFVCKKA